MVKVSRYCRGCSLHAGYLAHEQGIASAASWSIVTGANKSNSNANVLNAVATVSPANVWAVGSFYNTNSGTDLISQSEDLKGIETRIEVFSRNESAAKTILVSAQTNEVDLIVLCSHGQTGSERWALGSVAQKIVRHSEKPVLLVREDSPKPEKPIHALVPLDGSSFAETVLVPAAHLVAALSEKGTGVLHLVQVIDLPEDTSQQVIKLPVPEEQFKDLPEEPAVDEAITYLAGVTGTLKSNLAEIYHLDVYGYIAPGKDAADRIVEMAEAEVAALPGGFDLIALATHGRGGVLHWVLGSVTERVLSASKLPTLIVRPHKVLTD
jgi:nucleotide-binding universal stress UspA family protein